MNTKQQEIFQEIRSILHDLHSRWANDPESDGHHKSAEGEIIVYYPNWFVERDDYPTAPADGLGIYSYLFGPDRMHDFDSFEEALDAVKQWKKNYDEMIKWRNDQNETF